MLRDFFEKTGELSRGSGFLARFLLSFPKTTIGDRPYVDMPESSLCLDAFNNGIKKILDIEPVVDDLGKLKLRMMRLSVEAKQLWIEYYNSVENGSKRQGEFFDIKDVAAKSADNAARLAALVEMIDNPYSSNISEQSMMSGIALASWYLMEALRFFNETNLPVELSNAAKLSKWMVMHCHDNQSCSIGRSVLRRYGPIRNALLLQDAINELIDSNHISFKKEGRMIVYYVNKALLSEKSGLST